MSKTKIYDVSDVERTLQEAIDAYYNGATPTMSDSEFDKMVAKHRKMRAAAPELFPTPSVLDKVGAEPRATSGFQKVRHAVPMLSLDNLFEAEDGSCPDLDKWAEPLVLDNDWAVIEPKIDGLSLSVVYAADGRLLRAVTRGDGEEGEDVTANVIAGDLVPQQLPPGSPQGVEVRGEVFMDFRTFDRLNAKLEAEGQEKMANPRNAAAGAIRLHDPLESAKRSLRFIAYDIVNPTGCETHLEGLKALSAMGFTTPIWFPVSGALPPLSELKQTFTDLGYPIDGLVAKVNHLSRRLELGFTSRAPRWAMAIKFQQEKAVTTLRGITVQVGRSGVLTPIAELEPVWVDGSTISRATLHNEAQINRLQLRVGDQVEIEKSGGVIPAVLRAVGKRTLPVPPFSLLAHIAHQCPACGSANVAKAEDDDAAYRCLNPNCPAQLAARIKHFCSRGALNIDGIGDECSAAIADAWATYKLKPSAAAAGDSSMDVLLGLLEAPSHWLAALTWTTESGGTMTFGGARAQKAVRAFKDAISLPLNRWLYAIGIPTVGENTSKEISRLFKYAGDLRLACSGTGTLKRLADGELKASEALAKHQISHHLGPVSAKSVCDFMLSEDGEKFLRFLYRNDVASDNYAPVPETKTGALVGKTFVVTGTLSEPRETIHALIAANGGTVSGSVSAKTSVLVAGDKAGSKMEKARKLGVEVWSESELREAVAP